jgi:hypothetical protein
MFYTELSHGMTAEIIMFAKIFKTADPLVQNIGVHKWTVSQYTYPFYPKAVGGIA